MTKDKDNTKGVLNARLKAAEEPSEVSTPPSPPVAYTPPQNAYQRHQMAMLWWVEQQQAR